MTSLDLSVTAGVDSAGRVIGMVEHWPVVIIGFSALLPGAVGSFAIPESVPQPSTFPHGILS